jgi:Predicted membrane protein
VNVKLHDQRTVGQKAADEFTNAFGTWTYIIIQTVVIIIWMAINAVGLIYQWDPYPFILLNLGFSAQASYAAPLILMASNRSAQRDRLTLEHDAQEVDAILKIQDIQVELLQAIKAETALVKQLVDQTTKAAPDAQAGQPPR